jgi:uncharacterized cupin superfamily protein
VSEGFDLSQTFVHLGLGSTATLLPDFSWSNEYLERLHARFASDGKEGRLVCLLPQEATWDTWERHPAGDEIVVLLAGRVDVIQDLDGVEQVVELRPGHALVNPAGVWHTAQVHEPGSALFITPGEGTEVKPVS